MTIRDDDSILDDPGWFVWLHSRVRGQQYLCSACLCSSLTVREHISVTLLFSTGSLLIMEKVASVLNGDSLSFKAKEFYPVSRAR